MRTTHQTYLLDHAAIRQLRLEKANFIEYICSEDSIPRSQKHLKSATIYTPALYWLVKSSSNMQPLSDIRIAESTDDPGHAFPKEPDGNFNGQFGTSLSLGIRRYMFPA